MEESSAPLLEPWGRTGDRSTGSRQSQKEGGGQSIVVNCSDTGELAGLLAPRVTTWDVLTTPAQEPGGQATEEAAKGHPG